MSGVHRSFLKSKTRCSALWLLGDDLARTLHLGPSVELWAGQNLRG